MASADPIETGLFTWPAESPQLIGSRCKQCAEVTFPQQRSCPACTASETEEVLLGRRGKLWTWTIQRFPPPTPPFAGDAENFESFGVGYIELPEGVRVEARLTESDPERLEIDMDMELVLLPFRDIKRGEDRMIFAFQPVRD